MKGAMTILPKKKEGEESDCDSEGSGEASPSPAVRPPLPSGTHGGPPRSPDDSGGAFLPSSETYYHRCVGNETKFYIHVNCLGVCSVYISIDYGELT